MTASSAKSATLVTAAIRPSSAERLNRVQARIDGHFDTAAARTVDSRFRDVLTSAAVAGSGGKLLRPRLVLAAYEAFTSATDSATDSGSVARTHIQTDTGTPPPPAAVEDLALAFELLHMSFLHHDDVIDHDLIRRGRPNLIGTMRTTGERLGLEPARAAEYADACAVLIGDRLLHDAQRLIAEIDAPDPVRRRLLSILADAVEAAIEGEHADVLGGLLGTGDEAAALRIIDLKTARYSFSAPLEAGAVLAGAERADVRALSTIGELLGRAFQLRDDLLGVFGDDRVTGKSALSDLREGKLTLLVADARANPRWQSVAHLFGDRDLDSHGADALRQVIDASGARARVEHRIARTCAAAQRALVDSELPDALAGLLRRVIAETTEPVR